MEINEVFQDNGKVFVLGEIAGAHEGNLEYMKKLIQIAADADVDGVKFQIFRADDLVTQDHPKHAGFTEKEYSKEEWIEIANVTHDLNLHIFADVFDQESLEISKSMDVAGYKVHSTILSDYYLLKNIAAENKPVLIGVGGSTYDEVKVAIDILKNNDVVLLAGFQSFPTKLEDSNLNQIDYLKKEFGLAVGYADHCDAHTDMALVLPLMAAAKGARLIEKHFTMDRSTKGTDYFSSLNPDELKKLVGLIKDSEVVFGKAGMDEFSNEEEKYRLMMKKFIVAAEDIPAGTELTLDHLKFKRSNSAGVPPSKAEEMIGKKTTRDLKKDELVTFDDI